MTRAGQARGRPDGDGPGTARADPIVSLLRLQRQHLEAASPLYATVLDSVIDDVLAGGACREVLEPHAGDPFGSALGLRFLSAVHRLVLAGRGPALAAYYPSAGGGGTEAASASTTAAETATASGGLGRAAASGAGTGVGAAFVETVAAHRDEIALGLEVPVQTNEPGRSAALLGGFLTVAGASGLPLRVLELGASAGLNLRWDRFGYVAGGVRFGPADSPVQFVEPFVGRTPDLSVDVLVTDRGGCDPNPIDATTSEGRTLLRSFVWPDQRHRLE
jgi:hypothetical protein